MPDPWFTYCPSTCHMVAVALLSVACVGCEAQRPPTADELAKACAQCDSRSALDGASCYAALAKKLLDEGKRGVAEAKLKIAVEKMATALAEEGHKPDSLMEGLTELADVQFDVGQRETAREGLQRARGLMAQVETPREKAAALIRIARTQYHVRETSQALESLKEAESLAAMVGDALTMSDLLGQAALAYAAAGRPADAERLVQQALAKARSEADLVQRSTALAVVAAVLEELAKRPDAASVFGEARTAAESVTDPLKRAVALGEVGKRLVQTRRYTAGREVLVAAMELLTQAKDQSVAQPLRQELTPYVQKCNQAG